MSKISIIVLTRNVEDILEDCLKSVSWTDEIVVVDAESEDRTLEIAQKYKAKILHWKKGDYGGSRNKGAKKATGEWLFYVDSDERVTPELRQEVQHATRNTQHAAFAIPRRNFVFGKELHHGGWWPDYVIRLIRKDKLIRWEGELHEQPKINGTIGYLKNPLIHLKEDNLSDMVAKTNAWSEIEARLLFESGHPKMTWWRFFRPVLSEVFDRLILKLGFLDGVPGIIFSIYQGWSRFVTYAKLWELQNNKN